MEIILQPHEVNEKLQQAANIAVIDVRSKDEKYGTGKAAYEQEHIERAIYLDFKADLSGQGTFLPSIPALAEKLGAHGIRRETPVVIYDEGNHRAAAKAYVVLSYLGHETAYILNGGFKAWQEAGLPVTDRRPEAEPTRYDVQVDGTFLIDMEDVKDRLDKAGSVHIDSRAFERYTGEKEPKYQKAGHIPGAKNYHTKLLFDETGAYKDTDTLQAHFEQIADKEEVVVSCGSGNSACMNVVALKEAGLDNVKLYPGGFSEWIADEENEVAQGKE